MKNSSANRGATNSLFAQSAVAAFVIIVGCFWKLAAIGLVGPDEPRYAWIARAMSETGDWVTPRLYGQPWFEKPILYYWFAGLGFRVFHSPEWAARLPSAVAAFITALALAWCARRYFGREVAVAALLIFPTTVATLSMARAATPDMLLTCCVTLAMTFAAICLESRGELQPHPRAAETPPHSARAASQSSMQFYLILFGAALSLGALAKGPVAIILVIGALLLWCLHSRRWRSLLVFLRPAPVVTFFLFAAPWYALCAHRNPTFPRVFLLQHNIERYATPVFRHVQPFWFFGPIVLLAMLPWSFFLLLLIPDVLRFLSRRRNSAARHSPAIFFACWAVFPILFFSFSQSKLPPYILPAIPPLCLIVARSLERSIASRSRQLTWLLLSMGILSFEIAILLIVAGNDARGPFNAPAGTWQWIAVITGIGGLATLGLSICRKLRGAFVSAALTIALLATVTLNKILPSADPQLSTRPGAAEIAAMNPQIYRLNRAQQFGLNFYLHRELLEWSPDAPATKRQPTIVISSFPFLGKLRADRIVTNVGQWIFVFSVDPNVLSRPMSDPASNSLK